VYKSHTAHSVIEIKFLSHDPFLLKYKLSALIYMPATRELEEESFQVDSCTWSEFGRPTWKR